MRCWTIAAWVLAKAPVKDPNVIRVIGLNRMPISRRNGYVRRSKIGMKIMIVRGSMFYMISLGMPWSCIIPAIKISSSPTDSQVAYLER
jgi:hypothetical protein